MEIQEKLGHDASIFEETKVYIGLNDSKTKEQKLETSSYVSILKKICSVHGVPFSFSVVDGGYLHDDGQYIEEKTIVLSFIDVPKETIDDIAKEVCVLFNQESVLVTEEHVHARTVREVL
ncbi:MAG: hypothetical protein IJ131_06445 [Eggerthellaceae bacterium]|nr:hypothetical protein [Eggerthellaceae bacterium]